MAEKQGIKICSINVWGMNDNIKRKKVYMWLEEGKYDVIFIQETHCIDTDINRFNLDWKGKMFHSVSNSKHSRGVAIALSKYFECNVVKCNTDNKGRAINVNIECQGEDIALVNLYAPNDKKERRNFYNKCLKWVNRCNKAGPNLVIGGDMNCCLLDSDRTPATHLQDCSRKAFRCLIDSLDLQDCWEGEESIDKYTWCNADKSIKSRLDYIFLGRESVYHHSSIELKTVISSQVGQRPTDHKAVVVKLVKEGEGRGTGYWKLNVAYLKERDYATGVNNTIDQVLEEFENNRNICRRVVWEIVKLKIKEFSIGYCIRKKAEKKDRIKEIEGKLKRLSEKGNANVEQERGKLESELDRHYTFKAQGAQIRSRAEWIEEGEKNNKYFLQLENSRQQANVIHCLTVEDNEVYTSSEILKQLISFYETLYTSKSIDQKLIEEYVVNAKLPCRLNEEQKCSCEGLLSEREVAEVIQNIKTGKAPGSDGLPAELYKEFWPKLKLPFMSSVIETSVYGELPHSTRHAIISLIYKKGDRRLLKNYRPISLTNTDYKIIAFVLARRLQNVLPSIIDYDQAGYMKGRFIGNNIRVVLDIFDICESENRPGALIMLDYEKAFDTLEWTFMIETLKAFNFGNDFIRWIKILYTKPTFSVKNNGWVSRKCTMSRGIRQGCPLSALLFILSVEVLGVQIRQNKYIKGFKFGNKEYKISQYADDGILMLSDERSIQPAMDTVNAFCKIAGPRLNMQKVDGVWLGSLKSTMPETYAGITWTKEPVRCLGIYTGHNKQQCDVLNWDNKIDKISQLLNQWKRRNLTVFGKVVVIKTLIMPVFTYSASVLRPPQTFVSDLNRILKTFLGLKRYRLGISTMIGTVENGGIGFPDVISSLQSLKAVWISRLFDTETECPCRNTANYWYSKIGMDINYLVKCNFKVLKNFTILNKVSQFYQDIILAYNKCKTVKPVVESKAYEIASDVLWGNERFKYKGECLYIRNWIDSGILYVKDILNENGCLMEGEAIMNKLKNKANWISEYCMVKRVCKVVEQITQDLVNVSVNIVNRAPCIYVKNKVLDVINRKSGFYYTILREQNFKVPYMQKVWSRELNMESLKFQSTWNKIYKVKIKQMPIKKLAEFNYKLLLGTLPCGYVLSKWKDISEKCDVCYVKEDIKHMLFNCTKTHNIWNQVNNVMQIKLQWKHIVVGHYMEQNTTTTQINWICCLVAYSIFKANNYCKWNQVNYRDCDVKSRVVNDLVYFCKVQNMCRSTYLKSTLITKLVDLLSHNNI